MNSRQSRKKTAKRPEGKENKKGVVEETVPSRAKAAARQFLGLSDLEKDGPRREDGARGACRQDFAWRREKESSKERNTTKGGK